MRTSDLLKKVRKIEIKSKGLSNQIFSGEYHSAFKGRGMMFSEVREYMYGDPIRFIDWNVTARFNHPYVKIFEEERELTVMLIIDLSASGSFGSKETIKKDYIIEICAVLAFSAIQNNDKVGAILFTDKIEKFIPPKKGKSHILRIIRELIEFKPQHSGTNIEIPLGYLSNVIKKRSTTFLISDFMDNGYEKALRIANQKHDMVALNVYDPLEYEFSDLGLLQIQDFETGETSWVDTSDKVFQKNYKAELIKFQKNLEQTMKKSGVDLANIRTDRSYVKPLMNLFKKREQKR